MYMCVYIVLLLLSLLLVVLIVSFVVFVLSAEHLLRGAVVGHEAGVVRVLLLLKQPKAPVSGYLSCPLCKHCGNADKQQFKHVFKNEGQHSDPN